MTLKPHVVAIATRQSQNTNGKMRHEKKKAGLTKRRSFFDQARDEGWPVVGNIVPERWITPRRQKPDMSKIGMVCVDLFAGCGGMSLGIHQAGGHVAVAVDFEGWAALTYMRNLGKDPTKPVTYLCKDIRQVKGSEIIDALQEMGYEPFVDYMHMSPPCKDFSAVNTKVKAQYAKNPTMQLQHAYCLSESIRLLKEIRPKMFSFENVPGLVQGRMKPIFDAWLLRVKEAGYEVTWQLLDAADYGVPQHRVRVWAIGQVRGDIYEYDPWNLEALQMDEYANSCKANWQAEALKVWPAYWQENIASGLEKFMTYEEAVLKIKKAA